MASEFTVDTQALDKVAQVYADASTQWNQLLADMAGWTLADGDLGLIGRQAKVVSDYNQAVQTILDKVKTSAASLATAEKNLKTSANHYDQIEQAVTGGFNNMATGH